MLQDAPIILLDEPLNAVDDRTAADLLDLVKHWHGKSRTILVALHDLNVVRSIFPQTLLLRARNRGVGTHRGSADPTQSHGSAANERGLRRACA